MVAARQRLSARPRFRDPVADFQISSTSIHALAGTPVYRGVRGPYLSEHGPYVSLYFAGSTSDGVHATMDRTAPVDLVFSYTQIMAGFARFTPAPRTIGMLGLGGGSLAKHCYRHFPESRITVAEISAEVIALRRHFLIPDDDHRFSVLHMDGAALLRNSPKTFDVVLVDAFDEAGHLPHFSTAAFYKECYGALTAGGTLVLNFSGEQWRSGFDRLTRTFRGQVVLYRCPDGDNVIAFASKRPLPRWMTESGQHPLAEACDSPTAGLRSAAS